MKHIEFEDLGNQTWTVDIEKLTLLRTEEGKFYIFVEDTDIEVSSTTYHLVNNLLLGE
jgi:hypothetical protein